MLKVLGLLIVLSISSSYECTEDGYDAYLSEYSIKGVEDADKYEEL